MEISFADQGLEELDQLDADSILLFLPRTNGPLGGLAGLVDWRLTGQLTRYQRRGWFSGERGEKLLIPAHGRLPVTCLFGIGIGSVREIDEASVESLAEIAGRMLTEARVPSVACALPGAPESSTEYRDCLRSLRRGLSRTYRGRLVLMGDVKALQDAAT